MSYQTQTLQCKDCGNQFEWTAEEQEFYASKGFTNPPMRCKPCRIAKKQRMEGGRGGGGQRQSFPIVCSECGKDGTVPFEPRGDKPVLCQDCYQKQRKAA